MPSSIENKRRYYLLKRLWARQNDLDSEGIWKGKQEAVEAVALPLDFPSLAELEAAGYTTRDDLAGADETELIEQVKLSRSQAAAVLAALAAL